jgi:replicative DNA helicase
VQELVHRNDQELELTVIACALVWPECVGEPWSEMPVEVFYGEKNRQVWKEIKSQHREHGAFDLSTIIASFRAKGQLEDAFDTVTAAYRVYDGYHPCSAYASLYAHQLKRLYVIREKAKATQQYQANLAAGDTDGNAKLMLDALLTALDSTVRTYEPRSDEELAELIGPGSRYRTGISDIDGLTGGMAKPGLNILAARPSVGKSSLARSVIRRVVQRGDRVFWYSKDQSENQVLELEIAKLRGLNTDQVRRMDSSEAMRAIAEIRKDVWRDRVTLVDRPMPLADLLTAVHGATPDLVVIDYLQILDTGHDDEYESITAASKALKTLAFQLRIPILALAQFNRGYRPGQVPSLAHIRGSGQIEQDADQVWALDRDTTIATTEHQEADLYVLKNKVGPTGKVTLHWHARTASYEQTSRGGFA